MDARIRRSITEPLNAAGALKGMIFNWEQRKAIFVNERFVEYVENVLENEGTHSRLFYNPAEEE